MDLSLVIPCYNEEENIEAFFSETEKTFNNSGINIEYVFVNDGSTDKTKEILDKLFLKEKQSNITIVSFSRNFGKEAAILAGLNHSSGLYTCIIDADLQQRPETVLKMYDIIVNNINVDCVCAYQTSRKENKFMQFFKSMFYGIMNKIVESEIKNGASDFRIFNSKVKNAILELKEYHRFSKGIFSWVGFNTEFVEYEASDRNAGKTKWNFIKLTKYALEGITSFSIAPLKIATYSGFLTIIVSVICFLASFIKNIIKHTEYNTFSLLIMTILFFSGILLFTNGINGTYIAKTYQQVKNRPVYIIDTIKRRN